MRFTIGSSVTRLLFAAVIALVVSSIPAAAQQASGKFTLSKDVRWGSAVLPAGEYTYALQHETGQLLFLRSANGETGAIVLVKSATLVSDLEHDRIVLQRSGDDWFVSSMVISEIGQTLSFGSPGARSEAAKNGAVPAKVAALSIP